MKLRHDQIRQFQREGCLPVQGFFNASEISALRGELERFKAEGLLRNVSTEGDGATHSTQRMNLQICPISPKHSPLMRALPFAPKVVEAISDLIGSPAIFILDQIFLKPGGNGAGTSWHTDNSYFKVQDPALGTGMWIALHDATVANGTLHVIPRSHTYELPHERDPMSDHHIRCYPDESLAVPVELAAGGVLFFNFGILHSTRANTTPNERAGLALHFVNEKADLGRWRKTSKQQPYISGPCAQRGADAWDTAAPIWEEALDHQLLACARS